MPPVKTYDPTQVEIKIPPTVSRIAQISETRQALRICEDADLVLLVDTLSQPTRPVDTPIPRCGAILRHAWAHGLIEVCPRQKIKLSRLGRVVRDHLRFTREMERRL